LPLLPSSIFAYCVRRAHRFPALVAETCFRGRLIYHHAGVYWLTYRFSAGPTRIICKTFRNIGVYLTYFMSRDATLSCIPGKWSHETGVHIERPARVCVCARARRNGDFGSLCIHKHTHTASQFISLLPMRNGHWMQGKYPSIRIIVCAGQGMQRTKA
jgi:hypothetical protein